MFSLTFKLLAFRSGQGQRDCLRLSCNSKSKFELKRVKNSESKSNSCIALHPPVAEVMLAVLSCGVKPLALFPYTSMNKNGR